MDSDRLRPFEHLTSGFKRRREIDRELSYYAPVGTPCLVRDPAVKGSSLRPKVRRGIAKGMYREQVWFMGPFSKAKFRPKSHSAYRLQAGLTFSVVMGLGPMPSTHREMMLLEDMFLPMGSPVVIPAMAKSALQENAFLESKTITKRKVEVIDSNGKQLLTAMGGGVVYYPHGDGLLKPVDGAQYSLSNSPESSSTKDTGENPVEFVHASSQVAMDDTHDTSGPGNEFLQKMPGMAEPSDVEMFDFNLKRTLQSGVGDTLPQMFNSLYTILFYFHYVRNISNGYWGFSKMRRLRVCL